jgi:ActR/RegA family two-component response regulator
VRLLIVDDDAVFRQELAELMEQDGHGVTAVASVPKAVEALEAAEFDLIFTDLKMPRHNGLELLREVRSRWPRTLTVMITGFATVDTAVEAMKAGAFDYIQKPFRVPQVQKVLQLAEQEIQFQGRGGPPPDVDAIVRRWAEAGLSVLLVSARATPPQPQVTTLLTPPEPAAIRDYIENFLPTHPTPGIILEGVDRLFAAPQRGGFLPFVESIRVRLGDAGPLVVTYDPTRLSAAEGEDLQAALAGPVTRSTLEALSNPLRRAVLQRAGQGTISFTQALEAAGIDDSPKLSFHLRRLVEEGLLGHSGETYRITPRGEESLRLLVQWDSLSAGSRASSAALPRPD